MRETVEKIDIIGSLIHAVSKAFWLGVYGIIIVVCGIMFLAKPYVPPQPGTQEYNDFVKRNGHPPEYYAHKK